MQGMMRKISFGNCWLQVHSKNLYGMIDKIFVIDEEDEINYKKKLNSLNSEIIRVGDSKIRKSFPGI